MTTEDLLDAEELAGLEAAFTGLDGLRDLFVQQAKQVLPLVRGFPAQLDRHWARLCVVVGAGRTEEVHRLRPRFELLVRSRIDYLRKAERLTALAAALGADLPGRADLPRLLADLERFATRVLTPWRTPDDLEELAAADYPLSDAQLRAAAARHPAPQAWYDETQQP